MLYLHLKKRLAGEIKYIKFWRKRIKKTSGNKTGGLKAAATNKKRYGDGFYARIGAKGGRNGHTGGFAANRELASIAGAKGGRISRRGRAKIKTSLEERRRTETDREKLEKVGVWTKLKSFMS